MEEMKRTIRVLVWMALASILLTGSLMAQSNGVINGVVKDPTGAILPGVSVNLTDKATGRIQQTITSEVGRYSFAAVPPGQYSVSFELPGFKKLLRENVTVNVRDIVNIDVSLEVGAVASEVTVNEEAPLIQAESAALGRVVEQALVTGVPLSSRNFTQILALSPGVAADVPNAGAFGRNSVNIAANGARPCENSVVFNGLSGFGLASGVGFL